MKRLKAHVFWSPWSSRRSGRSAFPLLRQLCEEKCTVGQPLPVNLEPGTVPDSGPHTQKPPPLLSHVTFHSKSLSPEILLSRSVRHPYAMNPKVGFCRVYSTPACSAATCKANNATVCLLVHYLRQQRPRKAHWCVICPSQVSLCCSGRLLSNQK